MAKVKKSTEDGAENSSSDIDELAATLIKDLNKEHGMRVAYNLATDDAPTNVKRWIDTGSVLLNYAIRNAAGGGYPEGRIIEIAGMPSTGKSHLAYRAAVEVQRAGGLVIYVDTENATPVALLQKMGIDVRKRFVYCDTHCTEDVFSIIDSTITKAKSIVAKNVPILVVFDSIGGSSPRAELDGEYDQNSVGLQARVLAKGFRKITGLIGQNNVTLLCLNQLSTAIGVMHGDPHVSKGGNALPYHATIRIRLGSGNQVKGKDGNVIGSHVTVSIKKNKIAPPFRKLTFDIIFGKGIVENDPLFDEVKGWCKEHDGLKVNGKHIHITGEGAWKDFSVTDIATGEVLLAKKFYKAEFTEVCNIEAIKPYMDMLFDAALISNSDEPVDPSEDDDPTTDEA